MNRNGRYKGPSTQVVNLWWGAPSAPGDWVDEHECRVCGARYETFRGPESFHSAARLIRYRAKAEGDDGGGYRSRGPVLWVMRAAKLAAWFEAHYPCGCCWGITTGEREDP